ncbi:MAG: BsuPI-related putative proteinase inhibitor [Bryobacteraceae bacterium]
MKRVFGTTFTLAALSAGALFAGDLLPLQFGNTWTYRESRTGQEFTVRVSTPLMRDGQVYYSLMGYGTKTLFVRENENHDLVYLADETESELPLTVFAPSDRTWWEAPFRPCEQEGQTQSKRGSYDGSGGPFSNVLEVRYRSFGCADTGVTSEQYAENIGMVRRVTTSILGPVQFDLVYARVGNVLIDASPHARFTVSVVRPPTADFIQVGLRLQMDSALPLTLAFRSSQEYDAVLRDAEGRVVWQWSAEQVFAQVEHQKSVNGEWTASLQMPRSVLPADESQARTYSLQAWITTTGITPAFAATHPFALGPVPAK